MTSKKADLGTRPDRRSFLKGVSLSGVGLTLAAGSPDLAVAADAKTRSKRSVPLLPSADVEITAPHASFASTSDQTNPPPASAAASDRPLYASDFLVDALKQLNVMTVAEIPGSTFAAFQESIINRGMVREPKMDMLTVTHEEISVAFAHGYAKVTGNLAVALVHSVVGLQHASMAIYNAWCDRAPVLTITGSLTEPSSREGWVDWMHAVSDGPALTRDFTKFDETPRSLPHLADSLVRCYRMAMTPPLGPTVLAVDLDLQEQKIDPGTPLPVIKKPAIIPPQGDVGALREAVALLATAQSPVILVDRTVSSQAGLDHVVELAELLSAAVIDVGGRMNFPWRHPLNQTSRRPAVLRAADVILALEVQDLVGSTAGAGTARKIAISTYDYYLKANYQSFEPLPVADLEIAGHSEASLPTLIEEIRKALPSSATSAIEARLAALTSAHKTSIEASQKDAALAWNAKPITTARMCAEVYAQIRGRDWALLGGCHFQNMWPQQLWDAKRYHQYIGDSGGYGLGYLPGAAVGAAYAHKGEGRLPVVFGGDGDFMMTPGAIWTAANHSIPLLYIVHNNGGYHQEVMKIQQQANHRDRGIRRAEIGCVLPKIDYSLIARGMGVAAERVTEPQDLRRAIARALDVVGRGEPALLDVVSQGR